MEKVFLLNSGKTKTGITVICYAYKDPSDRYKKGLVTRDQFIDLADLHDSFRDDMFPMKCDAEFGYQDTYQGQARKIITKLVDPTGKTLFEILGKK